MYICDLYACVLRARAVFRSDKSLKSLTLSSKPRQLQWREWRRRLIILFFPSRKKRRRDVQEEMGEEGRTQWESFKVVIAPISIRSFFSVPLAFHLFDVTSGNENETNACVSNQAGNIARWSETKDLAADVEFEVFINWWLIIEFVSRRKLLILNKERVKNSHINCMYYIFINIMK